MQSADNVVAVVDEDVDDASVEDEGKNKGKSKSKKKAGNCSSLYRDWVTLVVHGDLAAVKAFADTHGDALKPPVLFPLAETSGTAFDYACLYGKADVAAYLHALRPDEYSGFCHLWWGASENALGPRFAPMPRPPALAELLATLEPRYGDARTLDRVPAQALYRKST
jgi:hypothetical protein